MVAAATAGVVPGAIVLGQPQRVIPARGRSRAGWCILCLILCW